jgi:dGTPase
VSHEIAFTEQKGQNDDMSEEHAHLTRRDQDDLESIEDRLLAPYAQRSADAPRRYSLRDQSRTLSYRTQFQRDRDRILHSQAFRRLKHKTQVYVAFEGDHHRTRLTHTLEVAQVARTMARALGLNEDLVEAIALAHDLGQPPFGNGGIEVMAAILSGREKIAWVQPKVLQDTGGFRPNYQSLRVVDRLEQRYDHPGINLSDPVREGVWKAGKVDDTIRYPDFRPTGLHPDQPPLLEAQVVAIADRLARLTHDLEDGIRSGEVAMTELEKTTIGRAVIQKLGEAYPDTIGAYRRRNAQIRGIIHTLVSDVVVRATEKLDEWAEANPEQEDFQFAAPDAPDDEEPGDDEANGSDAGHHARFRPAPRLPADTLGFSDRILSMVAELDDLVQTHIYRSRTVRRLDARARTFITGLFAAYYQDPLQLDDYALLRYRSEIGGSFLRDVPEEHVDQEIEQRYHNRPAFLRVIADHVAGMSDTYALKEYERLYLPFPDAERHF